MCQPYPGLRLKILAAAACISNNTQSKESWKNKLTEPTKKSYFLKKVEKQTTLLTTAINCHIPFPPPKKEKKRGKCLLIIKIKF